MGFSIGRFLGSIAPFVGGAIAGPIGAVIGTGVSAALADRPSPPSAGIGRQTVPGPVSTGKAIVQRTPQFQGGGFVPSSIAPTASLAAIPRLGRSAGPGLIDTFFGVGNGGGRKSPTSQILARAREATGGPVTRNKVIDAAKTCGLEVAADTFGIDVRDVCMLVVKGKTRRRRGVSAADIRRTKRTINFASKIRKDLKALAR